MSIPPPAVRVLPMDSKTEPGFAGASIEEIQQQFFLRQLPTRSPTPGQFEHRKAGLKAEAGTVVLFQFRGRIIASAVLLGSERFAPATSDGFDGAYYFDAKTIRVFDAVDAAGLREFWPNVSRLGQAKWSLDPRKYAAFERSVKGVEAHV